MNPLHIKFWVTSVCYVLCMCYIKSYSQAISSIQIKGRLIDSVTFQPLYSASVQFISLNSNYEVATLTDSSGYFSAIYAKSGTFLLKVYTLNYLNINRTVTIDTMKKTLDLGNISLIVDPKLLAEITVKGKKNLIENESGKTIINTQNKIFSSSNNGYELMLKIPGIVFSNGNFLINGNTIPDILVNGKRTPLTIEDIKTIPYENIQKIEIINNPGAKFEGDRKAIINIILKNNNKTQIVLFSEYGRNRYNQITSGVNVDLNAKKINTNLSIGYLDVPGYIQIYNERKYTENDNNYTLNIDSYIRNKIIYYYYNIQSEYKLDSLNIITLSYRGLKTATQQRPNGISRVYTDLGTLQRTTETNSISDIYSINSTYTLEYQHNFKSTNSKLNFEANLGTYDLNQSQRTTNFDIPLKLNIDGITSEAKSVINLKTINADFETPVFKTGILQVGTKYTSSTTNNKLNLDSLNNDVLQLGTNSYSDFVYKENIYSYYTNLSHGFAFGKIEIGVRAEFTRSNGKLQSTQNSLNRSYENFLPSFQFSKKVGGDNIITLSYAKKITRPSFRDLNPFVFIIDPFTQVSGNPTLNSSTYTNIRIDYNYKSINFGLGYRNQTGLITQLPTYDPYSNIITYSLRNLDMKKSISFDINFPINITPWWQIQNSTTCLYDKYSSTLQNGFFVKSKFKITNNLVNNITFMKNWQLNLNFFYSSPSVYNLYDVKEFSALDAGLSKSFLNNNLSLKINMSDIFLGRRNILTVDYLNLNNKLTQFTNTKNFTFRLTYTIGSIGSNSTKTNKKQDENQSRIKNNIN